MYEIQTSIRNLGQSIEALKNKIKNKLTAKEIAYSDEHTLLDLIKLIPYKITRPTPLYAPLKLHTIIKYENTLYILGGVDGRNNALNTHKIYNYPANTYVEKANYPTTIAYHAAVVWGNHILYSGGSTSSNNLTPTNTAYSYNKTSNTFVAKTVLPQTKLAHNATATENKVLISGGYSSTNNSPSNTQYTYDISSNTYTSVSNLKTITDYFSSVNTQNNKVLHSGGNQSASSRLNYIYDAKSNTIVDKSNLPSARSRHKSIVDPTNPDNVILIGGGAQSAETTTIGYNGPSDTFITKKAAPTTINSHTAIVKDDLVLLSGGVQGGITTDRQIIYQADRDRYVFD